jgi:hypothetical protein
MLTAAQQEALDAVQEYGSETAAAKALGIARGTMRHRLERARRNSEAYSAPGQPLQDYNLDRPDKTPQEAWDGHADAFERSVSKTLKTRWQTIKRGKGPFCIFHATDEHLDDDKVPLKLIEADIKAAHNLDAIMCHGGDALNNWPMAGKLAAQWAQQQCTAPDALLRLKHFIAIFKPHVWTDGNHEEMNPYLDHLISEMLPKGVIRDYWTVRFQIETPNAAPFRVVMSHKFSKGSSWFHKAHGHIREMLEGEEADLLMDGHVHSDGVLDHTLPERGHSDLCVASAGYKVVDKYAARISRNGTIPKLRGRAHWIIGDDQADLDESRFAAFKSPLQAEAYMNGLQNLRAI